MQEFSIEIAKNILKENREYPINFDHLITWCGLTSKSRATHYLINNYAVDVDYTQLAMSISIPNSLYLRIDASKEFANTCKTKEGRLYRNTFINAERELGIFNPVSMFSNYNKTVDDQKVTINDLQKQLTEIRQLILITNQRVDNLTENTKVRTKPEEVKVNIAKITGSSYREKLNSLVNQHVLDNQTKDKDGYRKAWNEVYFYFKEQTGIDLKRKASTYKNKEGKPKVTSGVEYAEQHRLISLLYELAKEILAY
jgi:hypothetical protein